MNRSELIDKVAKETDLDKKHADAAVAAFVNSVIAETTAGSKVSIFGFGTFTPKSRAARIGRNPRTGTPVKIAASKNVGFTAAQAYKDALNKRGGARKAAAKKVRPATKAAAKKTTAKAAAKKAPAKKAAKAPAKKTARATKSAKKR
ncbi:MAG: HU family DNA-binding protein [Acidimicrobiaceae bacterium]|nr:HU family DNA-binding protein [Acidimicrobiaceae bacterium]